MPFLLMALLTVACLPDVGSDFWPEPLLPTPWDPQQPSAAWSALLTGLGVALVGLNAWRMSRRVARPLDRDPNLRDRVLPRYERGRFVHQFALFALLGVALGVFGWGWAVGQFWKAAAAQLPWPELLVIAPFLAAMLLSWFFFYDADRASHRAAYRLFALDPLARALMDPKELETTLVPPSDAHRNFGGRWAYVLFQMRQKLALVLIPVGILLLQKEVQRRLTGLWSDWQAAINLAGSGCVLLAFVAMPWAVRLVLGLRPLPPGPLRDRLFAAARRLGFRCSNVLLWNTRSGMANAMVVGLLPWPRYVVFTDRLLEDFSPDEVEAVFGHEVGHVKHHHMLYYLGFLMLSIAVLGLLAHVLMHQLLPAYQGYEVVPLVVGLIVYVFVGFGFISRRCERQADVYGCRAVSCAAADCCEHGDGAALAARGGGLCPTGIRTFIRALEKVALVNGISRERPGFLQSWQHSTIAQRVGFLQRVLLDRGVERTFQRRVRLVKLAVAAVLCVALAALVLTPAIQQWLQGGQ